MGRDSKFNIDSFTGRSKVSIANFHQLDRLVDEEINSAGSKFELDYGVGSALYDVFETSASYGLKGAAAGPWGAIAGAFVGFGAGIFKASNKVDAANAKRSAFVSGLRELRFTNAALSRAASLASAAKDSRFTAIENATILKEKMAKNKAAQAAASLRNSSTNLRANYAKTLQSLTNKQSSLQVGLKATRNIIANAQTGFKEDFQFIQERHKLDRQAINQGVNLSLIHI